MASFLTDLEAGVVDAMVQGAVQKAAQNLADRGAISKAQVPIVTAGVTDAVVGIFKLYKVDKL